MKKVLLVLLIMITNLVCSNNFDKYESKRVFDKNIDILLTGNFDKYVNDQEMKRSLEETDLEGWKEFSQYFKDNKYDVINVKESRNRSELTVQVIYNSFSKVSSEEQLESFILEIEKMNKEIDENDNLEYKSEKDLEIKSLKNVYEKYEDRLQKDTKIIKVYMDKKKGLWSIIDDKKNNEEDPFGKNKELYFTFFVIFENFYDILKDIE